MKMKMRGNADPTGEREIVAGEIEPLAEQRLGAQ